MADAYLPVCIRHLSIGFAFDGHALKLNVRSYVDQGIVRVIAGPEACHLIVDIRRPYWRPARPQPIEASHGA